MTDVSAPWRSIVWAGQQSQAKADECRAKASWREVKDAPQTGPSPFKEAAISERSSSGRAGARPFPRWWRSNRRRPQCLGAVGGEEWREAGGGLQR